MNAEQKDLTTPTKTDANQHKEVQKDTSNQEKEVAQKKTTEATGTTEKVDPEKSEVEREGAKHPHKSTEPVATKETKKQ